MKNLPADNALATHYTGNYHEPTMQSKERQAVILFADLVGSARLSDVMAPSEYEGVVVAFQRTAADSAEKARSKLRKASVADCDVDVRGDQLVFIAVANEQTVDAKKQMQSVAVAILELAIDLSVRWFLSEKNEVRINNHATPFQIGVGIHSGNVIFGEHHRFHPDKTAAAKLRTPEGFPINFAKRVESLSRHGTSSGIALSQSFVGICRQAGLPLFLSQPLVGETKGFESPEPIYELLGQELVPSYSSSEHENDLFKESNMKLIEKAFKRAPERTGWLMEMAIGWLYWAGYKNQEWWTKGRDFALEAARVVQKPARFYFDAGRCSHKLGWNHDHSPNERDLLLAIAYHQAALTDPDMQWAASDLAIVHARFAENDSRWETKPSDDSIRLHLTDAKVVSDNLVKKWPAHFYSYFIRALISSLLVQAIARKAGQDGLEAHEPSPEMKDLSNQAERDWETMGHLNPHPKYLYHCVEVELRIAQRNYESARTALRKAREALQAEPEELYELGFRQQGVVVPGFRPPPRKSFDLRFEKLGKKIENFAGSVHSLPNLPA